jgi:hypothetical protein
MLQLLLDENISPVVADGLTARRPDIRITSLYTWLGGGLLGQADPVVLQAAAQDGLTGVTYDVTTIRPLIYEWAALGIEHAGVILVDKRTISSRDFGGLIRAIEALWDRECTAVWTNRTMFLDVP